MKKISYDGYRFPPEIIQQSIWLSPVHPELSRRRRLSLPRLLSSRAIDRDAVIAALETGISQFAAVPGESQNREGRAHERAARYWELKGDKLPTSVPDSLEQRA
jgi:hypothetical protein